jgi:hypothetical protein
MVGSSPPVLPLEMTAIAPAFKKASMTKGSLAPHKPTITVWGDVFLIRLAASMPFILGMVMSNKTTSADKLLPTQSLPARR